MGVLVSTLRDHLLARGYRKCQSRYINRRFGARVFEKNGKCVVAIPVIEIAPPDVAPISASIDDYFRQLQNALRNLVNGIPITDLVFSGGGTIPIPAWFFQWCRESGIRVHIMEPREEHPMEKIGN